MQKKLGRVVFDLSYAVDLNNLNQIDIAKSMLYEEILNAVQYNNLNYKINVVEDNTVRESDIPNFLKKSS